MKGHSLLTTTGRVAGSLVLAAGMLAAMSINRPPAARADFGDWATDAVCSIFPCAPFGYERPPAEEAPVPVQCGLGTILHVAATVDQPDYEFSIHCSNGRSLNSDWRFRTSYEPAIHRASERFVLSTGDARIDWDCPSDPWSTASRVSCTPQSNLGPLEMLHLSAPISATMLNAANRAALRGRLPFIVPSTTSTQATNSANRAATSAAAAAESSVHVDAPHNIPSTGTVTSKADLEVVSIDGPGLILSGQSSGYTTVIRNNGAAAMNIALNISFFGGLEAGQQVVADSGFNCTTNTKSFVCQNGTLGAGAQTTITFQARGRSSGSGQIGVTVNGAQTIAETRYDNNQSFLSVTIK